MDRMRSLLITKLNFIVISSVVLRLPDWVMDLSHAQGVRCEGDDEESGLLSEEKDLLEELALEKALNQSYNDEMNPTWDPYDKLAFRLSAYFQ